MANGTMAMPGGFVEPRANDRLKNSFNTWFWGALLAAAVLHFVVLAFFPDMTAADVSIRSSEIEQIEVLQEFEIPPPPEQIQRPAIPVISTDINIADDITISEVTFDENPVSDLPPPPTGQGVTSSDEPAFTPFEVAPRLTNQAQYARELERSYPPTLKDAGIGGQVVLWVQIDETGAVQQTRIVTSSGYDQLDRLAERLMNEVARFSPAQNRDQNVPVWVQLPVTFRAE